SVPRRAQYWKPKAMPLISRLSTGRAGTSAVTQSPALPTRGAAARGGPGCRLASISMIHTSGTTRIIPAAWPYTCERLADYFNLLLANVRHTSYSVDRVPNRSYHHSKRVL